MAPIHTLNLYQQPKVGSAFIRRYPTFHYQHKISANGWFDTMSCDLAMKSEVERETFLNQYIGARVAVYVDNPAAPIWEGLINRLSFSAGNWSYSISLDSMGNRTSVMHSTNTVVPNLSGPSDQAASQAIYGVKEIQADAGYQSNTGTGKVDALRTTLIAMQAWPQSSITQGGDAGGLMHLECIGLFYTLMWEKPFSTNGLVSFSNTLKTLYLPALANGATFFDNTDFTDIATNAIIQSRDTRTGASYWEWIRSMAEAGDGSNYWIAGITPTLPSSGKRRLYFRQANNASIEYTAHMADGLRVRNLYGRLVPPWTVVPDRGVRIQDMLPGWNGLGDDPRKTYIFSVDYEADAQRVTWVGADDTRAEGYFQLKTTQRPFGTPFGAPARTNLI